MAGVVFQCLKDISDPDAIGYAGRKDMLLQLSFLLNIYLTGLPSAVELSTLSLPMHRGTS